MGITTDSVQLGLTNIALVCALALALSLVVERVLELLKALYDLIDCRLGLHAYWTRRTIALRNYLQHRLRALEYVGPDVATGFLQKVNDVLLGPTHGYTGTIPTISGNLVRASAARIGAKTVGAFIGVVIAFALNLDLMALFEPPKDLLRHWLGLTATGLAIGLGAGPTHKLITSLERRRAMRDATPEVARV